MWKQIFATLKKLSYAQLLCTSRNNELWIHQWSTEEEKEVMPTMKKSDMIPHLPANFRETHNFWKFMEKKGWEYH